jgi:hypothetical protein
VLVLFLIQPHSPDLPKNNIPFFEEMADNWKLHKRRAAEPVTEKKVLRVLQFLLDCREVNRMEALIFADWYIVNFVLKLKSIE